MEDFVPAAEVAGLYSCGPTVYAYPHLGNMRAYVFADTLRRALRWKGIGVRHVVNITDVGHAVADTNTGEDKLEVAAARERRSVMDIAAYYTDVFLVDSAALNILPADEYPRASAYVEQMIEFAKKLDSGGFTYQIPSGLYFDTAKDPHYGELAQMSTEGQLEAARLEYVEGRRRKTDFALWRAEEPGKHRGAALGIPVGLGRPGLAPGVLGDEHGPARPALRPAHRRGGPSRAAPRQRDRAEPGLPRRRQALGPVLAAQRVPEARRP
jgi:cysteinyl-tRNA synthetase